MSPSRPGRNDPCNCGSGRKWKHCHGRPGSAAAPADPSTADGAADATDPVARLLAIAEPYIPAEGADDETMAGILQTAMLAWNLAVIEAAGEDTSETRAGIEAIDMHEEVAVMLARKKELFDADRQLFTEVTVGQDLNGRRVVQVRGKRPRPSRQ